MALDMRRTAEIITAGFAAAAVLAGLLAPVQLVQLPHAGARGPAIAYFFGAVTVSLAVSMLLARAGRRALLAVAMSAASAAMVLAGPLSFGPLFLPTFLLWLAVAFALCWFGHPRTVAVVAAAVVGLGVVLLAFALVVAFVP